MIAYSFPMMPNSISWWIANSSDRYILTAFSGVASTGIYSIAYKIPTILTTVSQIFVSAWRLSAVEKFGTEESIAFYQNVFKKLTAILLCSCSGLVLLNKPLASLLYQKEFYNAWKCVPFLLLASVFHANADFMGTIYTSAYKTKFLFFSTFIGATTNIVFNFALIPIWGGVGAAFATMVSYFVTWIIRLINSKSIIRLHYEISRDFLCYIVVFLQMCLAAFEFPREFFLHIFLSAIVIFIMHKDLFDIVSFLFHRFVKTSK
jgi:O-antigen/teichoic acid export membrane protein